MMREHIKNPKKLITVGLLIILINRVGCDAVGLNQQQLVDKLKADMVENLTGELTSAIQSGEKRVAGSTFYYDLLEPYQRVGINPNDPNLINSLRDIHSKIQANLEQDPSSTYRAQMSTEIRGLVQTGLTNYATSYLDQGSQDIISGLQALYAKGQQQMSNLAKAAEAMGNIAPDDPEIDLKITKTLTEYGISSDYFYVVDDLEHNIGILQGKIAEPLKAANMVYKAMGSKDPAYKIQMLFEMGETFSGKVPILGPLLEPLFTLAKGVLSAARGLETILEKNLNQGCINPGGGTFAVVNPQGEVANKRGEFIRLFPHVGRACPINMEIYSPIYNNIYFDVGAANQIFFYIKNKWHAGQVDDKHDGVNDIKAMVRWVRENNQVAKATDLNYIYKSYQKKYGITEYEKQIEEKLKEIGKLLRQSYNSVDHCDSEKLEKFFMRTIDLNWFDKLLKTGESGGLPFNEISSFSTRQVDIVRQMIHSYYIRNGRDNLNHLNNILKKLRDKTPVEISGYVEDESGKKISNVEIELSGASIHDFGSNCKRTTTGGSGKYNFYILLPLNSSKSLTLTAKSEEGESVSENVTVTPAEKRHWVVNFFIEDEEEECGKNEEWSDSQERCVCKDGYVEDENGDCVEKEEDHDCKDNEEWSDSQNRCICKDGFIENSNGECVKIKECQENEHFDADLDDCVCDEGFTENEEGKCVSDEEETVDECSIEYIESLSFLLELLVADTKLSETELMSYINKFNKEINDQSSNTCDNSIIAYCYYSALQVAARMKENISDVRDIAVEIIMLQAMCPDLNQQMQAEGITIKSLISSIAGLGAYDEKVEQMKSRLKENGCDEDEAEQDGEKVVPPEVDPGFIQEGGTSTELPGDGDDNDGDGQQDEKIPEVTGKNISLVIYDSGSAKDDVFSLSVSGYGVLGQTQAGGREHFNLNLSPGKTYTATVHVVIAPDDVGTYTLTVYYKGSQIDAISGSPSQGSSASLTFTVPDE